MNIKIDVNNFDFEELYIINSHIIHSIKMMRKRRPQNSSSSSNRSSPASNSSGPASSSSSPASYSSGPASSSSSPTSFISSTNNRSFDQEVRQKIDSDHMPNSPFRKSEPPTKQSLPRFSPSKASIYKNPENNNQYNRENTASSPFSPYSPIKYR